MSSSFATLARKTGEWSKNVVKNADERVKFRTSAVHTAIVLATPVDTGLARGNWQVSKDAPETDTVTLLSPSGYEAIAAGRHAIESYVGGSRNSALYITNNLVYIGPLNDGWSKQAPVGFIETAVMAGIRAVPSGGGILTRPVSRP